MIRDTVALLAMAGFLAAFCLLLPEIAGAVN